MITTQPYQFYWPWVPEEIHTYADAVRFAENMFYYFNGKVNPNFPAKGITFGINYTSDSVLGKNVVDMVVIYPHNIMKHVASVNNPNIDSEAKVSQLLKGTILYVVIHELLHMEQDFDAYYKRYKNPIPRIEMACHVMTIKYIDYLYDSQCYHLDIPIEYFEAFTPSLDNFFPYGKKRLDQNMERGESLFFSANPVEKAIYFWDLLLDGHFDTFSPTGSIKDLVNVDEDNEPIGTIVARFFIDREEIVKDMYIKYAGKWLSPDIILNIPRTIVLLEEPNPNNDEPGVYISSRLGCSENSPSTMSIDVSMATRPDRSLFDVVYKLDKREHPIFNV